MSITFPDNVWQSIAHHLESEAANVSLICKGSCKAGQSVLFRHLQLNGIVLGPRPIPGLKKKLVKRMMTCKQLSSSHVRHYVQRLEMLDWTSGHPDAQIWSYTEAVFNMAATFPNLAHISCTNVRFKSSSFYLLLVRPKPVETVTLHNCTIPFDDTVSHRFKEVTITKTEFMDKIAAQNFAWAISNLISPQHCQKFRLEGPKSILNDLLGSLVEKGEYLYLNSLELMVPTGYDRGELDALLTQCPNLHRLNLELDAQAAQFQTSVLPSSLQRSLQHIEVRLPAHGYISQDRIKENLAREFPRASHVVVVNAQVEVESSDGEVAIARCVNECRTESLGISLSRLENM